MKVFKSIEELKDFKHFNSVYSFLCKNNLLDLPKGRNEIDSDNYVNILEYETKNQNENHFEAHKQYYDIHYVIKGEEKIKWQDINKAKSINDYNEIDDCQLFSAENSFDIILNEGCFVVFAPNEIHKTCFAVDKPQKIRKAVFKIKVFDK